MAAPPPRHHAVDDLLVLHVDREGADGGAWRCAILDLSAGAARRAATGLPGGAHLPETLDRLDAWVMDEVVARARTWAFVVDGPAVLHSGLLVEAAMKGLPLRPYMRVYFDLLEEFRKCHAAAPMTASADLRAILTYISMEPDPDPVMQIEAVVRRLLADGHLFTAPMVVPELEQGPVASPRVPIMAPLVAPAIPVGGILRLRGLPWTSNENDIKTFFGGLTIAPDGIHLVVNAHGKVTGEAFMQVTTVEAVDQALLKHRQTMGKRYVEVFKSSPQEMMAMTQFTPDMRRLPQLPVMPAPQAPLAAPVPQHPPAAHPPPQPPPPVMPQQPHPQPQPQPQPQPKPQPQTQTQPQPAAQTPPQPQPQPVPQPQLPPTLSHSSPTPQQALTPPRPKAHQTQPPLPPQTLPPHQHQQSSPKIPAQPKPQPQLQQRQQHQPGPPPQGPPPPPQPPPPTQLIHDPRGVVVRGLPFDASYEDVRAVFSGLDFQPIGVQIVYGPDGGCVGEALVRFDSETAVESALRRNGCTVGKRTVSVLPATRPEPSPVTLINSTPYPPPHHASYPLQQFPPTHGIPTSLPALGRRASVPEEYLQSTAGQATAHAPPPPPPGPPTAVVRMRGLPYTCSIEDVVAFFRGFDIIENGVLFGSDRIGRASGEAWVTFTSPDQAERAVATLNKRHIGNRYIDLLLAHR